MSSKKVSVTLTYASSGAQPPVFLAGSFSEPEWGPQEMEFTTGENGELHFHKEVEVDEGGEYQYKFRIGHGDWWELNEQAPTGRSYSLIRYHIHSSPISKVKNHETQKPTH
jgi:hypothetical protein